MFVGVLCRIILVVSNMPSINTKDAVKGMIHFFFERESLVRSVTCF